VHVVDEGLDAVHLDDRDPLPVAALELGVAADVHLAELERHLGPHPLDHAARGVAEVTALGRVEDDGVLGYGYSPRVVVASATRPTASA
jgi:hypothetical protein